MSCPKIEFDITYKNKDELRDVFLGYIINDLRRIAE